MRLLRAQHKESPHASWHSKSRRSRRQQGPGDHLGFWIISARAEWFHWITILFSQTLGTALGDWVADDDRGGLGLGYEAVAAIFAGGLLIVGLLGLWPKISRTALFWVAFVLTRPLGATLGDLLDKPVAQGGLHFNRFSASGVLVAVAFIAGCILLIPQRAARRATSA